MVNKVRVNIAGTPYSIATTDPEKYILSLAKKLDEDITKLLDDNANLSVTKAAVFCAMDYLDEYRKSTGSAENMRSQIQDYIADATRAKLAGDPPPNPDRTQCRVYPDARIRSRPRRHWRGQGRHQSGDWHYSGYIFRRLAEPVTF